ncbi:hypothetical protein L6452_03626 [Arctium lappa]|uniref:Uncharacterized protein n=1 Tax=Arctium lappa TaxID=4217 RepID=A0ACB9FMR1_ARCLA|nr:hypothetical protein L6452_03626 [Arctium lappa]
MGHQLVILWTCFKILSCDYRVGQSYAFRDNLFMGMDKAYFLGLDFMVDYWVFIPKLYFRVSRILWLFPKHTLGLILFLLGYAPRSLSSLSLLNKVFSGFRPFPKKNTPKIHANREDATLTESNLLNGLYIVQYAWMEHYLEIKMYPAALRGYTTSNNKSD